MKVRHRRPDIRAKKAAYNKNYSTERYAQFRTEVDALKSTPCADCGGTFPACAMDFDHLGDKIANVSRMHNSNPAKLEAEIAKCEVVCSNCHRVRTSSRRSAGGITTSFRHPSH